MNFLPLWTEDTLLLQRRWEGRGEIKRTMRRKSRKGGCWPKSWESRKSHADLGTKGLLNPLEGARTLCCSAVDFVAVLCTLLLGDLERTLFPLEEVKSLSQGLNWKVVH